MIKQYKKTLVIPIYLFIFSFILWPQSINEKNGVVLNDPQREALKYFQELPSFQLQEQVVFLDVSGENFVFFPHDGRSVALVRNLGVKFWLNQPASFPEFMGAAYAHGHVWCVMMDPNKANPRAALYQHEIGTAIFSWTKLAEISLEHGIPNILVPLENENVFLAFSNGRGFTGENKDECSFVATYRLKNEILEFDSTVDLTLNNSSIFKKIKFQMPTGKPEHEAKGSGSYAFQACVAKPRSLWPSLWYPSISPEFVALTAPESGAIWIISLHSGSVVQTINMFSLSLSEIEQLKPLKQVILGTAFSPDGNLIIATRDPELVDLAIHASPQTNKEAQIGNTANITNPGERQKQDEQISELFFNQIIETKWWSINPKTGTKERLESPIDYPEKSQSFARQGRLRFLVGPRGNVLTNAFRTWDSLLRAMGLLFPEHDPIGGKPEAKRFMNTHSLPSGSLTKPPENPQSF